MYLDIRSGDRVSLVFDNEGGKKRDKANTEIMPDDTTGAEGDFTVQTKESNTDEIAVLTRSFNDMTQEIGGLVEDIKQQQKNLRIAETKLLQAQINPHFLYNTLDAIVWLAEENRKDEVVSMVTALSDFFRTTLSKGRDFITVREERSHIESYLKIQQFRYQDIMSYEIDMEENMGEFMIPKLTLQAISGKCSLSWPEK